MTTVKQPSPEESVAIAINYVIHGLNMVECYKKHKPNTKANAKSLRATASELFKWEVVQQSLANIQTTRAELAICDMKLTTKGQHAKLEAVIAQGMANNQLGSVVSAIDKQNQLGKLYDRDTTDAPEVHQQDYGFNDKVSPIKKKGGGRPRPSTSQ